MLQLHKASAELTAQLGIKVSRAGLSVTLHPV